jgi:hypothetical protein
MAFVATNSRAPGAEVRVLKEIGRAQVRGSSLTWISQHAGRLLGGFSPAADAAIFLDFHFGIFRYGATLNRSPTKSLVWCQLRRTPSAYPRD